MRGVPSEIAKALKELEGLNRIALAKRREAEFAEEQARAQAASIAILWKNHYDTLYARVKNRKK